MSGGPEQPSEAELRAPVRYEVADAIATLTLDRPHRLNAWTNRMGAALRAGLDRAAADPDVRVVVVTGAGRGFCAGADASALDALTEAGGYDALGGSAASFPPGPPRHPVLDPLFVPKPVIAAVNGPAAGLGLVLAVMCDLRFAAAGAKLTTSFGRLGLPAEHGVSWVLPRLVGTARAADLLFSARVVLAEEAECMGLVNAVHPADRLLAEVRTYAGRMAAQVSPRALAAMKEQLRLDLSRPLVDATEDARLRMDQMTGDPDFAEGVAAHTGRRPPRFRGLGPE